MDIFITGTDTDVGKTFVSRLLIEGLVRRFGQAVGLKPIASGADENQQFADLEQLIAASSQPLHYNDINLYRFTPAIAPHFAASAEGVMLKGHEIVDFCQHPQRPQAPIRLIEGAGGWLLPLSEHELLADTVLDQQWPIVLVVGVKLGCLNHALLTVREIQRSGGRLVGFIANILQPEQPMLEQNLADLQQRLQIPCLGIVPWLPDAKIRVVTAAKLVDELCTKVEKLK